jgi:hypothetical protein
MRNPSMAYIKTDYQKQFLMGDFSSPIIYALYKRFNKENITTIE